VTALDEVRKTEYSRLKGQDRAYIKGHKYTLLSHWENLTMSGREALEKRPAANQRLYTSFVPSRAITHRQGGPDKRSLGSGCCRQYSYLQGNTHARFYALGAGADLILYPKFAVHEFTS
jgi:hypothetical protein